MVTITLKWTWTRANGLRLTIQGSALWLLSKDLIIFRGPPTEGAEPRWVKRGSFTVGTQMDALKIGDMRTGQFQTIMPYADFRESLSFGVIDEPELSGDVPNLVENGWLSHIVRLQLFLGQDFGFGGLVLVVPDSGNRAPCGTPFQQRARQ